MILIPWLGMSFWLFMVTYLQHHSEEGVLYTEESWGFVKGAFETVDRDYGGTNARSDEFIYIYY